MRAEFKTKSIIQRFKRLKIDAFVIYIKKCLSSYRHFWRYILNTMRQPLNNSLLSACKKRFHWQANICLPLQKERWIPKAGLLAVSSHCPGRRSFPPAFLAQDTASPGAHIHVLLNTAAVAWSWCSKGCHKHQEPTKIKGTSVKIQISF